MAREPRLNIGILGAGITGLGLAERLTRLGHAVTVLEREPRIGGLCGAHDFGGFVWDRFYHVILPSDIELLEYLIEIGLGDQVRWKDTRTGFYIDGRMHSLSNAWEFLRFPALGLVDKLRLAMCITYCAHRNNGAPLEDVPIDVWLRKLCGATTYEKIWKPMLLARLGTGYREVSAVFIWSYIRRMYSARHSAARKETLGHVVGGYNTVLSRIRTLLNEKGAQLLTDTRVTRISPAHGRGVGVRTCTAGQAHRCHSFDTFIYTGPTALLGKLADPEMVHHSGNSNIDYLGVLCPAVVTRAPLTPFYVTNIADGSIPFTGVIGMSNVVDTTETNGRYLTYFPSYLAAHDPRFEFNDEQVVSATLAGLQRMFPTFDLSNLEAVHVNRAAHVQPLQTVGYSRRVVALHSRHPDLFVLNTSQLVTNTVNNDAALRAVSAFLSNHRDRFQIGARGG